MQDRRVIYKVFMFTSKGANVKVWGNLKVGVIGRVRVMVWVICRVSVKVGIVGRVRKGYC